MYLPYAKGGLQDSRITVDRQKLYYFQKVVDIICVDVDNARSTKVLTVYTNINFIAKKTFNSFLHTNVETPGLEAEYTLPRVIQN